MSLLQGVGGEPRASLVALARAENIKIGFKPLNVGKLAERSETRALFLVRLRALRECCCDRLPFGSGDHAVAEERGFHLLNGFIRPDAERLRELRHRLWHA